MSREFLDIHRTIERGDNLLRRPRALVRRNLLGGLQSSLVLEINRDPGCPERMTTNRGKDTGFKCAPSLMFPRLFASSNWRMRSPACLLN